MLNNFYTIFLSIILEGLPFIVLGSFIASLIQVFVTEDTVEKLIPKNKFLGLLMSASLGLIFPVCECAIVPIVRKLIKKGMPVNMAITFMLSVPIINPIVLLSTYYAFLGHPNMVILRAGCGVIGAMLIGYIVSLLHEGQVLRESIMTHDHCHDHHHHDHYHDHNHDEAEHHHNHHSHCSCGHDHKHEHDGERRGIIFEVIEHTSLEVYDVGKLYIIGALLSSAMQSFIPKAHILAIGKGNLSSILVMFALAFTLSICSETDAFIARTFLGQFTTGSILGFLILGPMIDIKNTIMLCGSFKLSFVVKLIFVIFAICFITAVLVNALPLSLIM